MPIEMLEKRVLSSDGKHELVGRVYLPDGGQSPCKIFHVVHGMTEHIARYDSFMRAMAEDGFIVFGYDHLGHGYTARDKSELGFIAHEDGWQRLVDDVAVFSNAVKEEYGPDLPYVLFGHSMGSFIVRLVASQYDLQDKLIVMGTGGPNPAAGAGLAMIRMIKTFKGERHISNLVEKLAFGSYNARFNEDDPKSWLSTDAEIRKTYATDPFCTFHFTASAMGDLIQLNRESNRKAWARGMNKQKPVLLISGSDDPVGDYGKGVQKVFDRLSAAGVPVQMKLYDGCRHEILNDTCRDQVIADIREFVQYVGEA